MFYQFKFFFEGAKGRDGGGGGGSIPNTPREEVYREIKDSFY